ncbi:MULTISPECIES: hypothetical protein [unclassified Leptolyngbya]|uniref:hypothetical protein n=1 Tax=unclassified Leptolyngbya TaxID=2650499 RepID=UPI0016899706|nr:MULTISPECIES: hypothetical protein [unclassified Leptolyngbya]MBD1914002.1 hypothetical protein [Leptolyngbya sp. FACHB-8]MBD2158066.1 hypothetical protein [Leptolyngbya sp. FACHB-16]
MLNSDDYMFQVTPGTRNHKGCFVQDTTYKLMSINQAGWALICMDEMSCHYVDPANICELTANREVELVIQ